MSETTFTQKGVIEQIASNAITVRIDCKSACSACHSKDICLSTERATKHVTVAPDGNSYTLGQSVTLYGEKQLAFKALFWGYLCPMLMVIATLIINIKIGMSESRAGIFALLVLVPYYLLLYALRDHFKRKFIFKIKL